MKCLCSILFRLGEKWTIAPTDIIRDNIQAGQVTQEIVVTSNVAAERTVSLSAVVTPPAGGLASDVILQTTSAKVKGQATISVAFLVVSTFKAGDYAIALTVDTNPA